MKTNNKTPKTPKTPKSPVIDDLNTRETWYFLREVSKFYNNMLLNHYYNNMCQCGISYRRTVNNTDDVEKKLCNTKRCIEGRANINASSDLLNLSFFDTDIKPTYQYRFNSNIVHDNSLYEVTTFASYLQTFEIVIGEFDAQKFAMSELDKLKSISRRKYTEYIKKRSNNECPKRVRNYLNGVVVKSDNNDYSLTRVMVKRIKKDIEQAKRKRTRVQLVSSKDIEW